jgi:N-carbamoylputrescine amidase
MVTLAAIVVISVPASTKDIRRIKVAAVQTPNLDGQYQQAKEIAERLIIQAAEQGARIIVLPEFALVGYVYHDDIWDLAEPLDGPTTEWMQSLCKRYDIYLGTCILEVRGNHFYDTFVLVGPGEGELWAHRKIEPALYEARYFKGAGINPSVFETTVGRIGVSICMDNSKTHTINNLLAGKPDILLMSFAGPQIPIVPERFNEMTIDTQNGTPLVYARILDVPVVLCNKTGRWNSPLPGAPGVKARSDFVARSRIVSSEGEVLATLHKEESFAIAEVEIKTERHPDPSSVPEGRWLTTPDPLIRFFSDFTLRISQTRYRWSKAREQAVEEVKKRHH